MKRLFKIFFYFLFYFLCNVFIYYSPRKTIIINDNPPLFFTISFLNTKLYSEQIQNTREYIFIKTNSILINLAISISQYNLNYNLLLVTFFYC